MKDLVIWFVHTPAGAIALVCTPIAMFTKKGCFLHKKAGSIFTVAMTIMLISGFIAAWLKHSVDDMFLSVIVLYTLFTAWLTVQRRNSATGLLEYASLVFVISIAIVALTCVVIGPERSGSNMAMGWLILAAVFSTGDLHNLYRKGLQGKLRIIRHILRIGFSLVWAVLALIDKIIKMRGFDLKQMSNEQALLFAGVPAALLLVFFLYWLLTIALSRDLKSLLN